MTSSVVMRFQKCEIQRMNTKKSIDFRIIAFLKLLFSIISKVLYVLIVYIYVRNT